MSIRKLNNKKKVRHFILPLFLTFAIYSFGQNPAAVKLIDSADAYLHSDPKLSLKLLDEIPKPIEKTLKGHLTDYYGLRGFVHYELDNMSRVHHNFLLAIEHAELEKKYDEGGSYCIELHNVELDTDVENREALLAKARYFFNKSGNKEGLIEVEQQYGNRAFYKNDFEECVRLNLLILDKTRKAQDQYLRLLTTYMLASSYYNLSDYKRGEQFFAEMLTLRNKNGVEDKNYFYNVSSLYYDKAIYFYEKEQVDSAKIFYNKVPAYHRYSGSAFKKDYFELGIDLYKLAGESSISSLYKDSIMELQAAENAKGKKEIFDANRKVLDLDKGLKKASTTKIWYLISLVLVLCITIWLIFRYSKKRKAWKIAKSKKAEEIRQLKKDQQLMSVNIVNLGEYISELKASLKTMAQSNEKDAQKNKLKELYNELNLVSGTLLNEGKIQKMTTINQEFLSYIKNVFPDLTESEQEVCYYLYLGMKNKEIATHLNTTIRAIESSRYRISKKMNVATKGVSVKEYIQNNLQKQEVY